MTDPLWGLPDPDRQAEFYSDVAVKRAIAWVVDTALVALLTVLALPLTAFLGLFFLPVLFLFLGFLYRWATIARFSATLGMRMLGIEFRDRFGQRFDAGLAFLHTMGFSVISAFVLPQLISGALMATTRRGQGLVDMFLGTTAINRAA